MSVTRSQAPVSGFHFRHDLDAQMPAHRSDPMTNDPMTNVTDHPGCGAGATREDPGGHRESLGLDDKSQLTSLHESLR